MQEINRAQNSKLLGQKAQNCQYNYASNNSQIQNKRNNSIQIQGKINSSHKQESQFKNSPKIIANSIRTLKNKIQQVKLTQSQALAGIAVSASLIFGGPVFAETTTIKFPASQDPGIFTVQRTLVEAWSILREMYYDNNFNGINWESELIDKLKSVYSQETEGKAYEEVTSLVSELGDPFTRLISPEDYHNFRISSDGEVQGVGLLIASDANNGQLVVLAPLKGGPAERAGVKPGDVLISINGQSTKGWSGEKAAQNLRGSTGSHVDVKFARFNSLNRFTVAQNIETVSQVTKMQDDILNNKINENKQVSDVLKATEKPEDQQVSFSEFSLQREAVQLSPITSATLSVNKETVGYIRLVNFSNNAASDLNHALTSLKTQGAQKFILDLRGNPGGLVESSMDIAGQFLNTNQTVFSVKGRPMDPVQKVNVLADSKGINSDPLIVLINSDSASASEILAGALQDNHRALLLGEKTYGKGKMQSVFELGDGSGLFVTVAQYLSPEEHVIDKLGIQPDMACNISDKSLLNQIKDKDRIIDGQFMNIEDIEDDKCVMSAEKLFATNKM